MYRALVSFSGVISMAKDEVREITNKDTVKDLIKAGYIEVVKSSDTKELQKENSRLSEELQKANETIEELNKRLEELEKVTDEMGSKEETETSDVTGNKEEE